MIESVKRIKILDELINANLISINMNYGIKEVELSFNMDFSITLSNHNNEYEKEDDYFMLYFEDRKIVSYSQLDGLIIDKEC